MNKKIVKFLKIVLLAILLLVGREVVFAADINLTIRNGANIVFSGTLSLPTGITSLSDPNGTPYPIDASSVLAVLGEADQANATFNISNLTYFSSFNSLYLKCITDSIGEKCDNWQYTVNNNYLGIGMDKKILSDGDNVYLYFGPQNKVILNSSSITTSENLTVTTQKYDYHNDQWINRTEVTVGLTQPDPENPWTPVEIQTILVGENGQAVFSAIPEGAYNIGIKEDFYFPTEVLIVTIPPPPVQISISSGNGSSYAPPPVEKAKFNIKKAFEFLISQQKEDGSFGEDLYTDWIALALASGNYQEPVIKLIKYFGEFKIIDASLTDYERHSMALMSLGLNPHNINGENYIKKITDSFDGKQFGDANEDNDDIFALIVLQNAGYAQDDKMIRDDISFVLSRQKENGSWDESIDMTGAGIQALAFFNQDEQVKSALKKARGFLKQNQKDNGGWNNNASSTAWVTGGIFALSEKPEDWIKNGNTPFDYLATLQDIDGGIKNLPAGMEGEYKQNKIWETAYVASALSGKTWNQIMQKFEKPKEIKGQSLENSPRTVLGTSKNKTAKKIIKNEMLTATVLSAIIPPPAPTKIEQTQIPEKNWFLKFLDKIFSIF